MLKMPWNPLSWLTVSLFYQSCLIYPKDLRDIYEKINLLDLAMTTASSIIIFKEYIVRSLAGLKLCIKLSAWVIFFPVAGATAIGFQVITMNCSREFFLQPCAAELTLDSMDTTWEIQRTASHLTQSPINYPYLILFVTIDHSPCSTGDQKQLSLLPLCWIWMVPTETHQINSNWHHLAKAVDSHLTWHKACRLV